MVDSVLSLVSQWYDTPPLAVNVVAVPSHTVVSPVIVTTGTVFTVTNRLPVEEQLAAFVTVT